MLTGRATVLLVTDGLDHEAIDMLDTEMARLRRFAYRIVWLNPLLRFEDERANFRCVDEEAKAILIVVVAVGMSEIAHRRGSVRDSSICPLRRPRQRRALTHPSG